MCILEQCTLLKMLDVVQCALPLIVPVLGKDIFPVLDGLNVLRVRGIRTNTVLLNRGLIP